MRINITDRVTVGFHPYNFWFHVFHPWIWSCWGLFELPHKTTYYSGKMTWWSWWRLYVTVEKP